MWRTPETAMEMVMETATKTFQLEKNSGNGMDFPGDLQIILASSSPRRIQMFRDHGHEPVVLPSCVEERVPFPMDPTDLVRYLAMKKALSVRKQGDLPGGKGLIVAADTIVLRDEILGKPIDRADAARILKVLCGRDHQVMTGVALIRTDIPLGRLFVETSHVVFDSYQEEDLQTYLDSPEPYDKAGAYAIQGTFGKYIREVRGDVSNIMGLPWNRLCLEIQSVL